MRLESHHIMFIMAMAVLALIVVSDFYTLQRNATKTSESLNHGYKMATPKDILEEIK